MRNDLGRACPRCGLRLPNTLERCASCGGPLGSAEAALAPGVGWRKLFTGVRPWRDALLWVPAFVLVLAVALGSLALAVVSIATTPQGMSAGAGVALAILALCAGVAGLGILAFVAWLPWAGMVALASWLTTRSKKPDLLRCVPFAQPIHSRRVARLIAAPFERLFEMKRWRIWATLFGLALLIELCAEIFSKHPFFADQTLLSSLELAGIAVLAQAMMLAMLFVPLNYGFAASEEVIDRLVRLGSVMRHARAIAVGRDVERAREESSRGRDRAAGIARATVDGELVAPLSGERCLAFRLWGRIDGLEIDDGDAKGFEVASETPVMARGKVWVVALEEPNEMLGEIDPTQRERVLGLLRSRGIAQEKLASVELGESLLRDGDEVLVIGKATSERVAGAGYRDAAMHTVIDDSDGHPLWIQRR